MGAGAGVPQDIVARVGALVNEGCQLCQSAMRAEGIKVLALMSRDVAQMAHISCHIERAKWERIVDVRGPSLLLLHGACQGGHVKSWVSCHSSELRRWTGCPTPVLDSTALLC